MPLGPFGEVIGTTGTLEGLPDKVKRYKTKVIAPRNPRLKRESTGEVKVCFFFTFLDCLNLLF